MGYSLNCLGVPPCLFTREGGTGGTEYSGWGEERLVPGGGPGAERCPS